MTTQLQGLRSVIHPVSDLDASKGWWQTFLGAAPYFDEPFYVGFSVGGYELGLLPDGDVSEGAVVYWGVNNVSDAIDDAIREGAALREEATDVGDGIITGSVYLRDGTIVGFILNPHFNVT
jgi:catechol 2,3-dioxygenase-like lactoylglutathione lyase family enzyme